MAKRIGILLAGAAVLLGLWYVYGYGSVTPEGQAPLSSLRAENLETLEKQFNDSSDSTRVIVLLSPT